MVGKGFSFHLFTVVAFVVIFLLDFLVLSGVFEQAKGIVRFDCWLTSCVFISDIGFGSVWCDGFIFARTSFFLKEGLAWYAITRGNGKIWFSNLLFLINVQCFRKMPFNSLYIIRVLCDKDQFSGCLVGFNCSSKGFSSVAELNVFDVADNLVLFVSSLSLCINLSVIDLKLASFELVLFVSPLAITLMVVGR